MSEIETEKTKVVSIIEKVTSDIQFGMLSLRVATQLQNSVKSGQLPSHAWLYRVVAAVCWRDTLITLARLLDRPLRGGVVSVWYLLDYSQQNVHEYPLASHDEVKREAISLRSALESNPIIETVKKIRDYTLAHTDRQHITNPPAVAIVSPDIVAIEGAYREVLRILNVFKGHYNDSTFVADVAVLHVDHDLSFLLRLFEKERQSRAERRDALLRRAREHPQS
jgi:hypothetical protein